MAWTSPQFTKTEVDKAGAALAENKATKIEYQIVDNWRAAHNYPLNSLQIDLRRRAKSVDRDCIVAQRIKRLSSIAEKLGQSSTRLSQMQDIGGCRAVLGNVRLVNKLAVNYASYVGNHKLESVKNYIETPKPTGYRGIHIIYRYAGKKTEYQNLKIEIQLRSLNQHAWATAVETVGLFTHQALKSNRGKGDWLRFFALMGNAIAYKEKGNPVPRTPAFGDGLKDMLIEYLEKLNVGDQLRSYSDALQEVWKQQKPTDYYFVLDIDPYTKELEVASFKRSEFRDANAYYLEVEKDIRGTAKNAVLVSVQRTTDLRKAYPNYFLDTTMFMDLVDWATK